jgi:hypothetical protein
VVLDDCGLLSRRENEATYRSPPFRERLTCAHIDQQGAWKYNRGGQTSVHAGRRTNDRPNATRRERGRCRATGMVQRTRRAEPTSARWNRNLLGFSTGWSAGLIARLKTYQDHPRAPSISPRREVFALSGPRW